MQMLRRVFRIVQTDVELLSLLYYYLTIMLIMPNKVINGLQNIDNATILLYILDITSV